MGMISPLWLGLLALSAVFATTGQLLFKVGASRAQAWHDFINLTIGFGLLAYGASTALWVVALSRLPLKLVYPFTALTLVMVYVSAAIFLGEKFSVRGFMGTLLVLGGLGLILLDK